MTIQEQLYTVEDMMLMPDNGKHYELINGKFIEMPPSSKKTPSWRLGLFMSTPLPIK